MKSLSSQVDSVVSYREEYCHCIIAGALRALPVLICNCMEESSCLFTKMLKGVSYHAGDS